MTPAPSIQELIETVQRDAGSDDVLDQLATASATVNELNETSDAVLGYFVDRARRAGKSWVEISKVLGVTKQAVHKRFGSAAAAPKISRLERFTQRARHIVEAAPQVAKEKGHDFVGTEHILLAQYTEPGSIAAKVLVEAGLDEDRVREEIRALVPDGPGPVEGDVAFTPRAAEVMGGVLPVALELGHNYIGTEHILLALYRDPESVAAKVLNRLGLDAETAREKVIEALSAFRAS